MVRQLFILILFSSLSIAKRNQFGSSPTIVYSKSTHCLLSNSYLKTFSKTFYVGLDNLKLLDECGREKWRFETKSRGGDDELRCDQVFQRGYVFTVDTSDAMVDLELVVSLYATMKTSKKELGKAIVFMPSVNRDWTSDLFMDDSNWWIYLIKVIGEPYKILPLDSRLAAMQKIMCFKELVAQIPKFNLTRDLVSSFVSMVKQHLRLNQTESNRIIFTSSIPDSLVHEAQLTTPVEIIDKQMPFEDQLRFIQTAAIFVVNDQSDLTRALFLPQNSIVLRVVTSSNPHLTDLLRKRGAYVEWQFEEKKINEFGDVLKKIQRHCKID